MIGLLDPNAQLVALLLLIILCLVTIESCRRDSRGPVENEKAFLFRGKSALYSLASNTGSVFSLTYFFGGVVIYGYFFGLSYLVAALLIVALSLVLLWRAIGQIGQSAAIETAPGNVLLDCLKSRLSPQDFRVMVRVYSIVYFMLLVEELAVSRLVITKLLPSHPALSALALGLICIVVFIYLSLGGFRAVLNSDLVQMGVIAAFVLSLMFLMAKTHSLPSISAPTTGLRSPAGDLASLAMALVFGVSWFVGSLDFFARLNFTSNRLVSQTRQRQAFAAISLICVFVVITIGILYGMHLRAVLPSLNSPSVYTETVIVHFLTLGRPVISALFVVTLFCMVFTTLDTLLLTLVQVDTYRATSWLSRASLARFLLLAVGLSCLIEFELVPAFGIFVGSLMILPAMGIAKAIYSPWKRIAPPSLAALDWALFGSGVIFALLVPSIKTEFELHYLLPAIVFCAAAVATLTSHARKLGARR